ncbi:MAG: hypothetical protein IT378_11625, partial [Sandaracinaceae bacterium]|nr:hypothetical protein [Sandaracinaceae bacterium]
MTLRALSSSVLLSSILCVACGGGPITGDCRTDGCPDPFVCVETMGMAECACPAGTRPEAGGCVPITTCTPDACRMRGTCFEEAGGVRCECDPQYTGVGCELCAEGYFDDGMGGCSTDPCAAVRCEGDQVCVVRDAGAACECPAGTHLEGTLCVPDTTCTPTTCNGHGTCEAQGSMLTCRCDQGWTGARCDACDAAMGFHDDGMGGCTTDVCVPSPCADPHRGVCVEDALGRAQCNCDPGYHLEVDACVVDEVCETDTCNGHGACTIEAGLARCACEAGYAGGRCDTCATGYHDDGMGGCTTDACLPSPCTMPGRGVCTDLGGTARCDCDPGLHEDGVGGCTADPCRPDPCVAMNQACRAAGGAAECYTPVCNDNNPCTIDSVAGGNCRYDPLPNGTGCSTSICRTGETCTAGSCGGGSAVVCNDNNSCTDDACVAPSGCTYTPDPTNVPDDGLACTIDSCMGSSEAHVPSDALCDDAAWCTGVEVCMPGSGADARGCRRTSVPAPPGPDGPCSTWTCDEPNDRFVRSDRPEGSMCNDTIACTTGDACRSGTCRGTPTADCGATTCSSTTTLTALEVELSAAHVSGSLVHAGSSTFPGSQSSNTISIYLRSRDTGVHHALESVSFGSWNGSAYPPASFNQNDDRALDLSVLPGVYDVVYYRAASGDFVSRTANADPYPFARHVLQSDLVIGPGENALTIDLAAARVTGSLLHMGTSTFPGSGSSNTITVYLRSRATGAHHALESVSFGSWNGSAYPVASFNQNDDRAIDLAVVPGAYDVVYYRAASGDFVSRTSDADPYPFARHVLRENVVIGPGPTTLNVDLAASRVTGSLVHMGSGTFPGSESSNTITVYLRSRSTGAHHALESVSFGSWNGSAYPVASFNPNDDRAINLAVLPGAYDVVYHRAASGDFVSRTSSADPYPFARHVLRENVVIGPGAVALDVELAASRVTGAILHGGSSTFPGSQSSNTITLYLRSRSTGAHHALESVSF